MNRSNISFFRKNNEIMLPITAGVAVIFAFVLVLIFTLRRFALRDLQPRKEKRRQTDKEQHHKNIVSSSPCHRLTRLIFVLVVFLACIYSVFLQFFNYSNHLLMADVEPKNFQFHSSLANGEKACKIYCSELNMNQRINRTKEPAFALSDDMCREMENVFLERLLDIQQGVSCSSLILSYKGEMHIY